MLFLKRKMLASNRVAVILLFTIAFAVVILFRQMAWLGSNYSASQDPQPLLRTADKQKYDLSLAILVAGSVNRFLFDSFAQHVANTNNNVLVDYFAILTLQSGKAFRADSGYMGHLMGHDKLFDGIDFGLVDDSTKNGKAVNYINTIRRAMMGAMRSSVSSKSPRTTSIKALRLLDQPIEDDPILDPIRKLDQWPMKDLRPKALERTKTGNQNILRLFLALESLWENEFLEYETARKDSYDYVLIVRDDTLWLDDFDLQKVIATDPTADAYVLSCDAREPKMLPPEINDHGILVKRSKAHIFGKYISSMVKEGNLQACHENSQVRELLGKERGCNSEMILRHIINQNNIKVKLVPQSLLPFQRSVRIEGNNGGDGYYCYHKFCQSVDAPLQLPPDIKKCKELQFDR